MLYVIIFIIYKSLYKVILLIRYIPIFNVIIFGYDMTQHEMYYSFIRNKIIFN